MSRTFAAGSGCIDNGGALDRHGIQIDNTISLTIGVFLSAAGAANSTAFGGNRDSVGGTGVRGGEGAGGVGNTGSTGKSIFCTGTAICFHVGDVHGSGSHRCRSVIGKTYGESLCF